MQTAFRRLPTGHRPGSVGQVLAVVFGSRFGVTSAIHGRGDPGEDTPEPPVRLADVNRTSSRPVAAQQRQPAGRPDIERNVVTLRRENGRLPGPDADPALLRVRRTPGLDERFDERQQPPTPTGRTVTSPNEADPQRGCDDR